MVQSAGSAMLQQPMAAVAARLYRLRGQVRRQLFVRGMASWLWMLLAILAVDFALDRTFRFDQPQRAVLLAGIVGILAWYGYRWLLKPLTAPASDDALLLTVERAHPRLAQRLIGGLQLARIGDPRAQGMSPALVRRAVLEASRLSEEIRFDQVLDERGHSRRVLLLVLAGAIAFTLALGVTVTEPLGLWFRRNLLVSSHLWPTATVLIVEGLNANGTVSAPRGQNFVQAVTIGENSRVLPTAVYLDVRDERSTSSLVMKRNSTRRFEMSFPGLTEACEFRARGGDGVTPWITVRLVDPPELTEVRLLATPPSYTGAAPQELPAGQSPYDLLPGSSLHVEAKANKELAHARLVVQGQPLIQSSAPSERLIRTIPLNQVGAMFVGDMPPPVVLEGTYSFEAQDRLGFDGRGLPTFMIRRLKDQSPQVQIVLRGIGSLVLPTARISMEVTAADDFGLVNLQARLRQTGSTTDVPAEETKVDLATAQSQLAAASGQERGARRELVLDEAIDLAELKVSAGNGLQLWVEARDNDTVNGPNVGRSTEIVLRVVTESELLADLLRREKEVRQELATVAKEQNELVTEIRALAAALGDRIDTSLEQAAVLTSLERRQRIVGERTLAVAERLFQMAAEIVNNRLEDGGGRMSRRLSDELGAPLRTIADGPIRSASDSLAVGRRAETVVRRTHDFDRAMTFGRQAAEDLNTVLQRMVQAEGFQEAVNLLYEIQRAQGEVHEQTRRAQAERVRRILEGQQPAPQP